MAQASSLPAWANGFESDSIMEQARTEFIDRLSNSDDLVESLQQVYEGHRLINVRRLAAYGLLELGIANTLQLGFWIIEIIEHSGIRMFDCCKNITIAIWLVVV